MLHINDLVKILRDSLCVLLEINESDCSSSLSYVHDRDSAPSDRKMIVWIFNER